MDRETARRRLSYGLPLGALAALVYSRWRARTDAATDRRVITERHAAPFLVSRRVEPGAVESILDHIERTFTDAKPRRLLGLEEASTASLFIDHGENPPQLVWYVEVPRAVVAQWDDPERTVADAFPVAHDALESPTRSTGDLCDRTLLVHAVNPARPRTLAVSDGNEERSLEVAIGADAPVDVDLVRMRLESGFPERFADWFERVTQRVIDGDLDLKRIESRSAEMLEAERMYTESLFLERNADGYACYLYMEADEMERVYDAFYDTRNPVARISERVLGRLLEEPERVLEYPLETDARLLAHAVNPDRPRRPDECRKR